MRGIHDRSMLGSLTLEERIHVLEKVVVDQRGILVNHIEKNNLEEELKNRVIDKWNDIEEAISSKGRKAKW